jgi:hypothetical protein
MGLFSKSVPAHYAEMRALLDDILLSPTPYRHASTRKGLREFYSDSFVTGFVIGTWFQFCKLPNRDGSLDARLLLEISEWFGIGWMGSDNIWVGLYQRATRKDFVKLMELYDREDNADYRAGIRNGTQFVRWKYGVGDVVSEPEIQAANEQAWRRAGAIPDTPVSHAEVTEVLFARLYTDIVAERFKAARVG